MVGTFEEDVDDRLEAGRDVTDREDDVIDVGMWVLVVAEMMPAARPRQEVLLPVRTKNGNEEFWDIGLEETVDNSLYHPWETLTEFQTYAWAIGLKFMTIVTAKLMGMFGVARSL